MADLRIVDAPLLSTVKGTEKIPTGGEGNFSVSVNQVADFTKLKWVLATEGYVGNAVGNVQADLNLHKNNESNPHNVTKTQVGLGNVDNTADLDKPVSNANVAALSLKADKTYVDNQLTFKANKVDVYTKQESSDLVNNSISTALTPVNDSLDLAKRGIANRYDPSLTYNSGERVLLDNGTEVISTISSNTNDPNVNMDGWRKPQASEIFDESGLSQQELNRNINLSFDLFGADSSGATACDNQLIAAFNASRDQKRKVVNSKGVYLLNGTQDIEIAFDYDLSGTVFKLGSNFTGSIKITKNETTTSHISGAILDKFKSLGVLLAGKSNFTGLSSADGLDNNYIKIYANQDMYTYSGAVSKRFELNRLLKRGQLLSPFMYDLDCSLITRVDLQQVSKNILTGTGLTIDETSFGNGVTIVKIDDGNGFDLSNFKFIDNASSVATNTKDKIMIGMNAHDIRIDYVDTSSTYINSSNTSNYTITMWESLGIELNHICSDGYGWGATGSNNCRRLSIKNSQLSRVDFHKPFHEWLKIDDCVIGNWGVLVTAMGDLTINNTKFLMRQGYNNNGFIRSRDDTGGFCNGKLTMNNVTIEGDVSVGTKALLRCQRNTAAPIPVGSPVHAEFWTDIEINGITVKNNVLSPLIESNQGANLALMLPKSIVINHFYSDVSLQPNIMVSQFLKRDEGVRIFIDDAKLNAMSFLDPSNIGTKLDTSISKLRGLIPFSGTQIDNTADGVFNFIDSNILKYREYSGAWSTFVPVVNFIGGALQNTTDAIYFDCQGVAKNRIKTIGMRFNYGNSTAMKDDLKFFSAINATWNGEPKFSLYSGDGTLNTATVTYPTGGDIVLSIRNNSGKIDTVTIDTTISATVPLPVNGGTIVTTAGTNVSMQVNVTNLLKVDLISS